MVAISGAGRGSVAGASGDAGTEYRRGVAAFAVACGFAGVPLPGMEIPAEHAQVASVSLETDDPVDDIRIDFESGWRAFVQAKRTLNAGTSLKKAVAQWVPAANSGLDPTTDRLVIAAGNLSGPMRDLQRVLNRERTDSPGACTKREAQVLSLVRNLLADLDDAECSLALRCAVICELRVEEVDETESQLAIAHLRHVVADGGHHSAREAWQALMRISGKTARLRGGYKLASWLDAVHGDRIEISTGGTAPAAVLETRRQALARYTARVSRVGLEIDLRALGAELPNLALTEADAGIRVRTDSDQNESALIWAFLRRGRAVLTGLPGGGKTTALKHLAALLASDCTLPLPVFASLREINSGDPHISFRDRLIACAVRDERPADRDVLTNEINARLDGDGAAALLLDSLDETYNGRATTVSEIAKLVAGVPEGACILLATRDVAYGQAATLGWPSLRLRPPETPERAVSAVLEMAAAQPMSAVKDGPTWVAERASWVQSALAHDQLLRETPLLPVLLALLAARKSTASLPKSRARILEAVVTDIVATRELHQSRGRALGPINGAALRTAGLHAFTTEAFEILNSQGQADAASIADAVSVTMRDFWGLSPGEATTAAWEAVRMLDENGIFVILGAEETVTPRIPLFAEIGDAMRIATRTDEIEDWVNARIAGEQFEAIVLACTLNAAVTSAAYSALQVRPSDAALANTLVQASREGVDLDGEMIRLVCECLIRHVATATHAGWQSWEALLFLPIPSELRASAEAAANMHGPGHALVARVSLDLHFHSGSLSATDTAVLKEVIALQSLPHKPSGDRGALYDVTAWQVDDTLISTQEKVAEALLDHVHEAAELVVARAINAPSGLQESLMQLLAERGFNDEVQAINDSLAQVYARVKFPSWFYDSGSSVYTHFLSLLACDVKAELSTLQASRLDELADFLTTIDMNDVAVMLLHKQTDDTLRQLIDLTVSLYGFDRAVLAAQASIAFTRMKHWDGDAVYFALFDYARARTEPDWSRIDDVSAAVLLFMRLFMLGTGQAQFAAKSLWRAPVGADAAPLLRSLLPKLVTQTTHHRMAAETLASFAGGPEPISWLSSDEPVLRAVAARWIEPLSGDSVSDGLLKLLDDPDGHVQEAAIRRLVGARPSDLSEILTRIAGRPAAGWMCLSCRTINKPSDTTSCSKNGCYAAGPNPAVLAHKSQAALSA